MGPIVRKIRYKKPVGIDYITYEIVLANDIDSNLHVYFIKLNAFTDGREEADPVIADTISVVLQKFLGYAISEALMDHIKEDVMRELDILFTMDRQFHGYSLIKEGDLNAY